ncbi:uncharacterized protein LOC133806050 [Humulus lupulus]|uniref:uncharacterized protein LOC133806050 n=1 Tax=Humulus lupulus TaxID=3486 RepID=UPI002B4178D8|nr:uncharacterized protein LOC133806050 [Humulus lupulus]
MPQQPMNQASSSQHPRPLAPPDRPNELQVALLTLTNTQTQFMTETRSSIKNLETQSSVKQSVVQNEDLGEKSDTVEQGVIKDHKSTEKIPLVVVDQPARVPYPQRLRKTTIDKQFSKFLEVFKKPHINIPFVEALEKMPSYVKFMKEILYKKRKMEDYETVAVTEECSAILQRKLPQKLRDPGSFTIPCTIGKFECKHALCDLGARINLMPLFVFRRLGLGEARPTTVTLQLADRSVKHPQGIIEDVLVKEDTDVPIILGRPFLATGQALIDVQKGELKLRVQGDEVVFNVFNAMVYSRASESCYSVNVIDKAVSKRRVSSDALEAMLIGGEEDDDDVEMREYVNWINSYQPYRKKFEDLAKGPKRPLTSIQQPPQLELKALPVLRILG